MTTRRMQWFTSEQVFASLPFGVSGNLLLYNILSQDASPVKGATVTRMLVDLRIQAAGTASRVDMPWGIVLVNADARAAGAFPDPEDLADRAGWLARGRLMTVQDSLSDASQWDRVALDLRSQRVMRNEKDELHLLVHNTTTGTLLWAAYIRVLMKMP